MIDFAKITVSAGRGGDGAGSFRRIKGKRRGRADGGDGGAGGNVYCQATHDLNTLEPYRFVKDYQAKPGRSGLSNLRRGANGRDLILKVPVGTVITISNFKFQISNFFDLTQEGQKVLVARGGEGGRGNAKLCDEFGRRPKIGERGSVGEACEVILELKLIADVGLIGLPNAGKSTLLAVLTAARPQIASYPFTTLEPNLGVLWISARGPVSSFLPASAPQPFSSKIDNPNVDIKSKKGWVRAVGSPSTAATPRESKPAALVLADIPGLIEGASKGKGLGDLFLRHIERTKILIHLIDISQDTDKWQDYQTIRGELKAYSKELAKKKEIIVLSKIDLVDKKKVEKLLKFFKSKKKKVLVISAKNKEGLGELVGEILKRRAG